MQSLLIIIIININKLHSGRGHKGGNPCLLKMVRDKESLQDMINTIFLFPGLFKAAVGGAGTRQHL